MIERKQTTIAQFSSRTGMSGVNVAATKTDNPGCELPRPKGRGFSLRDCSRRLNF